MQEERNLPATTQTIKSLQLLLDKNKNQFAMVLPKNLPLDRFLRICMSTVTQNPKLLQCEPRTFLRSVLQCASLGLEPGGPLGQAHLVPFYNGQRRQLECQSIIDYKGYVALAHRSKEVGRISSTIIYEKEPWKFSEGDVIVHTPLPPSERGTRKVMVYAKAFDRSGILIAQEYLWAEEVEDIKKKSLDQKKNAAMNPWTTNEEAMWRKSPVRRLAKWMPMAAEMQMAARLEEAQEEGFDPQLDIDLNLGEEKQPSDAEQKTEAKAEALKEKLRRAQTDSAGAPAGQPAKPGVEGAEATPGLPHEEEPPPHGDGDEPMVAPPPSSGAEEAPSPPPPPEPPKQEPPKKETPKSPPKPKEPTTFGPKDGPKIEAGKKVADYWIDIDMVKCPTGGEKAGQLTKITFCNQTCKFRKRCFLFHD
jgi:recombination protein RecT